MFNRSPEQRSMGMAVLLLLAYYLFGLGANLCFKEGGTDASHRLWYFIVGNAFGITSTAALMGVYARMQVNLAMVLATSGTFVVVQLAFWLIYHTPLTWLHGVGIVLVGVGTALASRAGQTPADAETAAAVREEISSCS